MLRAAVFELPIGRANDSVPKLFHFVDGESLCVDSRLDLERLDLLYFHVLFVHCFSCFEIVDNYVG
jgi:hypothetical protein